MAAITWAGEEGMPARSGSVPAIPPTEATIGMNVAQHENPCCATLSDASGTFEGHSAVATAAALRHAAHLL